MNTPLEPTQSRSATAAYLRGATPGAIGTFVGLGSTAATEICARAGFDWLLLDLEHGGGAETYLNAHTHVAARFGALTIVRVETPSRIRCSRALDLGADGIMAPRIDSAEEAQEFVRHLHYPPEGDRGVASYHTAAGYGLVEGYFDNPPEPLAFVQIESAGALASVEAIARVPGVDVLFVGPRDLAASVGCAPELGDTTFRDAVTHVAEVARANGVSSSILAGSSKAAAQYAELGFTSIAVASDSNLMAVAAQKAASTARDALNR